MQGVPASSPRVIRRVSPSIALALVLGSSLGCDNVGGGGGQLECSDAPEIEVAATFDGRAHVFDEGRANIYMAGTAKDPCIDYVVVTAKGQDGAIEVFLRPPEGGGPLEVTSVGFGGPFSPEDYGLYPEDLGKFNAALNLEQSNDDCAQASLEVTGSDARMYLAASEDWGPYMLTNVSLSVSGTYAIEWQDAACE